MWNNPFTYGNPISDPARFFGRTREVRQIFDRLRNKEFESSSIVGERRIGKTSLLNFITDPDVRAAQDLSPERYTFINVDFQMLGEAMGPDELWRRLLQSMRRDCTDQTIGEIVAVIESRERLDNFELDELFHDIDARGQHLVFLLDEFDRVTENANFGPEFYYGLRSLVTRHRIALVTSSRLDLVDLCHSEPVKSSPFFNIFAKFSLRLFSEKDALSLISRSLLETPVRFTESETEHVLNLAGRHPYFLKVACGKLFEAYQLGYDGTMRMDFLSREFRAQADPHFVGYWDNSNDDEKITLTAAALLEMTRPTQEFSLGELQRVFSRSEPGVEDLSERGLLIRRDGMVRLFSPALGPWIVRQISADLAEEQSYHEWLARNGSMERITGRRGPLRKTLPKIGARYRKLILTWASDPQTLPAMASLLNSVLTLVNEAKTL